MKRITVAMTKGGVGKSVIASSLAVHATKESDRVAMVDLNGDQGSLTQWWRLRGRPKNPHLFEKPTDLVKDLDAIELDGWEFCIIDTPPSYSKVVLFSVMVADVVIIPIKASIFDAGALQPILDRCSEFKKPFALVMSDVDSKFKSLNAGVMAGLKNRAVLEDAKISHLQAYAAALNIGKTGAELDDKAAKEIEALWHAVMFYADIAPARKVRSYGRR
jgi:chromosome partitioning protein